MVDQYVFSCHAANHLYSQCYAWACGSFFDYTQSIVWHVLSPYLLILLFFIIGGSAAYEFYVFREGGHSLAKQLNGRRLVLLKSTPEESSALKFPISWPKVCSRTSCAICTAR